MKTRILLVMLFAALAAAGALVPLLVLGDSGRAGSRRVAPAVATTPTESRARPAESLRGASDPWGARSNERSELSARSVLQRGTRSAPRWILAGRVRGFASATPPVVSVEVVGGAAHLRRATRAERELRGAARPDGHFVFDVTGLLTPPNAEPPAELLPGAIGVAVRATAAEHLPVEAWVDAASALERRTSDGEELRLIAVDLELQRIAALTGRVLDAQGEPAVEASVHLMRLSTGDARDPQSLAWTVPDAQGDFYLLTNHTGSFQVLFVDERHRPGSARVSLALGRISPLSPLRLEAGAPLDGRALPRMDGSAQEGSILHLIRLAGGREFLCGSRLLQFDGERFEHARRTTAVQRGGAFRFDGVAPGEHRLVSAGLGGACGFSDILGNAIDVLAPAQGLQVAFDEPRLRFQVDGPAGPLAGARVGLLDALTQEAVACATAPDGAVEVQTQAFVPYAVDVRADGHEPLRYEIVSPSRGATLVEQVELHPAIAKGTLELTVRDEAGAPVTRASLGFFAPEARAAEPLFRREGLASDGVLQFPDLPPGDYHVQVQPGESYLIEADLALEVVSGDTTRASLELGRGGRLRLRVCDSGGRLLPATCRVEDARGSEVSLRYSFRSSSGGELHESRLRLHPAGPARDAFAEALPALASGDYSASFALSGFSTRRVSFRIERGQVCSLEVVLEPLPSPEKGH